MQYSEKVMDHFTHPRNVGEIENADGVGTVVRADEKGLRLEIGDAAYTHRSVHGGSLTCELRSEGGVFYIVNGFFKAGFGIVYNESRAACTEVGMVVGAVEDIGYAACC